MSSLFIMTIRTDWAKQVRLGYFRISYFCILQQHFVGGIVSSQQQSSELM
jgi:hypothetical protein